MPLVTGRVVEKYTKQPVQAARVDIGLYTTYTDANGNFSLDVPTGRQAFRIEHQSFYTITHTLPVRARTSMGLIKMESRVRAL